jgi:two-component system, NarL family, sensor kinase
MKKLSIIVIALCVFYGFGQQTKTISEKEFEELRSKIEQLALKNPDSANIYTDKLMKLAKDSDKKMAKAISTIAFIKFSQSQEDEALKLYNKSLLINKKLNNQAGIAENYSFLGRINEYKANYVEAAKFYYASIDLAVKLNLNSTIFNNYLGLGQINLVNRNYDKALNYFFKALAIQKKIPNPKNKADIYVSLGTCYTFMNKQNLAEKYFGEAYEYYNKKGYLFEMASVLVERSNLYYETDPLKAIELQLQAQKNYNKTEPNCSGSAYNIAYLGESFFELAKNDSLIKQIKNYEIPKTKEKLLVEAENYYIRALSIFKKNKNSEWILTTTGLISDLQAYRGDYENAYKNLQFKFKFNDSLFSQKNKNAIAKLESEKEVLQLKTLNDQKATLNKILIGSSIGLLLLGFLGYRNFRTKQKLQNLKISELEKDKQLLAIDAMMKGQEEERSRIAKDLHDGLGGLLSGTKLSFTTMKENLILTPENAVQFDKSLTMLDNTMSDLRKVAHNLMPEALVKFGLTEALKDFCSGIQSTKTVSVIYQKLGSDEKYENTTEVFIYRIVQELVNNALKHAQATEILVQLATHKNRIHITVEDNGVGYEIDTIQNKKGNGLNNVEYRVNYLNGTIDTVSSPSNGTAVNIEFKI